MKHQHETTSETVITDAVVADVARATHSDPRSVIRRIVGLPVRGRRGALIDDELDARRITRTKRSA